MSTIVMHVENEYSSPGIEEEIFPNKDKVNSTVPCFIWELNGAFLGQIHVSCYSKQFHMIMGQDIAFAAMFMDLNRISISAALKEWVLMISPIFIKFLRYFVQLLG